MPRVSFTQNLKRFFPGLGDVEVEGGTVAEVISAVEKRYPGLSSYLLDERGSLRKHVNIFVGETMVQDRRRLKDPVGDGDRVYVAQALSGGL